MRGTRGFTLLELMVALAIFAVLASVAAPALDDMLRSSSLGTQRDRLLRDLAFARQTAVLSGHPITVCSSGDGQACSAASWSAGWIVFADVVDSHDCVDLDADGFCDGHGGEVLSVFQLSNPGWISVTGNANIANRVRFVATGKAATNGTFSFCDAHGRVAPRTIRIAASGRVRTGTAEQASC